jgi:hypothetical protein
MEREARKDRNLSCCGNCTETEDGIKKRKPLTRSLSNVAPGSKTRSWYMIYLEHRKQSSPSLIVHPPLLLLLFLLVLLSFFFFLALFDRLFIREFLLL